jgi:hypothetical protein
MRGAKIDTMTSALYITNSSLKIALLTGVCPGRIGLLLLYYFFDLIQIQVNYIRIKKF